MDETFGVKHTHDWQPVEGIQARYRCADPDCRAIGYRNVHKAAMDAPRDAIIPYKCNFHDHTTGTTCGDDSIVRRASRQRCRKHLGRPEKKRVPEVQAIRSRRALQVLRKDLLEVKADIVKTWQDRLLTVEGYEEVLSVLNAEIRAVEDQLRKLGQ